MNYEYIGKLRQKLFFTTGDFAQVFGIKKSSALVACNRYTKRGIFLRLKKDFYVVRDGFREYPREKSYKISNFLQVPSYISLTTALGFYEITTQVQRDYYENVSVKRSVSYDGENKTFKYYKLNKRLYFDFIKINGYFIATKEKAFLDLVYLYSFGKYKPDLSAIDTSKLDTKRIKKIYSFYPEKTKRIVRKICRI